LIVFFNVYVCLVEKKIFPEFVKNLHIFFGWGGGGHT